MSYVFPGDNHVVNECSFPEFEMILNDADPLGHETSSREGASETILPFKNTLAAGQLKTRTTLRPTSRATVAGVYPVLAS
jgi:hypothetical protein